MKLASYIDHTILKTEATVEEIQILCQEAAENKCAAVCVNSCYFDLAAHLLRGTGVKVATVVGFPLGASITAVKVYETIEAIRRKADEIVMVINIGAIKSNQWQAIIEDIQAVVTAVERKTVKVIIETCLMNEEEKRQACQAVLDSGAHYIKTSTGFSTSGATEEDIKLFKALLGDRIGIKASGGVRTREQAEAMIAAGATRLEQVLE